MSLQAEYIRWFEELNKQDIPLVGGKNASLGEMVGALRPAGIKVPPGFATMAAAYRNISSPRMASTKKSRRASRSIMPETSRCIKQEKPFAD